MANTFEQTSSLVSKRLVHALHEKSMLPSTLNKEYSADFSQKNYVPGETLEINLIHQPTVTKGRVATVQDIDNIKTSVLIEQYNAAEKFETLDQTYNIFETHGALKYADDMANAMLRKVDTTGFDFMAENTGNVVGVAGTDAGALRTWEEGAAKIADQLGPERNCYAAVNPWGHVALTDSLKGCVNPANTIGNQTLTARMKELGSLNFYKSQSISRHTAGTATNATPLMNGATVNGATTISIDGLSAATATVKAKTHFTIDNVYAVDPESKVTLPYLKDFVVTTDSVGVASAIAALPISSTIYGPDSSHQNVSALPVNDAAITFNTISGATASNNIIYDKDAYTLVSVPLRNAQGGVHTQKLVNGINIRVGYGSWSATDDTQIFRIDAVWGYGKLRENHACVVQGA